MFPDWFFIRFSLRLSIFLLDVIAPFAILWSLTAYLTYPAPPPIIFSPFGLSVNSIFAHHDLLLAFTSWLAVEAIWRVLHFIGRRLIANGLWDLRGEDKVQIGTEERWRIWVRMMESAEDPWSWLGGMFLEKGYRRAKRGMDDPAVTKVRMEDVGRVNVQEFIAHFLFQRSLSSIKRKTIERAELHSMLVLLEHAITESRSWDLPPFRFARGKSPHRTFLIYDQEIITSHQPLLFFVLIWCSSAMGNSALWLGGFKYYGPARMWPFPPFFMRGSRRSLDSLIDPKGAPKSLDAILGDKIGYWYHPGSQKAQEEGQTPVLFFHGISGTYGPALAILYLQQKTGRPFFVPEFPYVTMRLHPPSTIVTRRETVALARRMLHRHGFGLDTDSGSEGEDEDWRKGKFVLCGHSLGSGPCAWVLRDAPDLVAGSVLVDPMSVWLFAGDSPRNFFRSSCRTAGEIFFKYFASERGISHFMSRHLRWTDSVIFASEPAAPLAQSAHYYIPRIALSPQNPPFSIPFYAPYVSPCPSGPFPTVFFYSEKDCILPVPKIIKYLESSGFDERSLRVIPGAEHAAILIRPKWLREVAKAIDQVAAAGEKVEEARWEGYETD